MEQTDSSNALCVLIGAAPRTESVLIQGTGSSRAARINRCRKFRAHGQMPVRLPPDHFVLRATAARQNRRPPRHGVGIAG
jgi:hypothetical protein